MGAPTASPTILEEAFSMETLKVATETALQALLEYLEDDALAGVKLVPPNELLIQARCRERAENPAHGQGRSVKTADHGRGALLLAKDAKGCTEAEDEP